MRHPATLRILGRRSLTRSRAVLPSLCCVLFLFIYTAQAHAQATPTSGDTCNGTYTGTFDGNLTLTVGQICNFTSGGISGNVTLNGGTFILSNATVHGNVQVSGGGNLVVTNAAVLGDVQINGGGAFSIGPSTFINGNLEIQDIPAGPAQNQICGTTVSKNLHVQNNETPVEIGSPPVCAGNAPPGP